MYTFKITDKNGKCKEYNHIIKVCYTAPVPGAKEIVKRGSKHGRSNRNRITG